MFTILVTGGLGFVGSHISIQLLKKGFNVVIIDSLINSSKEIFEGLKEIFNLEVVNPNNKLYFEEIDLCKNLKKSGGKIYLSKKIVIDHLGASSVKRNQNFELEKNRNWHWMWSTFYFNKKHKGFVRALIMVFPKLISSFFKYLLFFILRDQEKKNIYYNRISGLTNSIAGKSSWYRPKMQK